MDQTNIPESAIDPGRNVYEDPDTALKEAAGLAERGHFEEAERLCAEVLRLRGRSSGAYNQIGVIRYAQQRVSEACSYFGTAYSLDEGHLDAGKNLADVLLELGRGEEAISVYRKLGRSSPQDPELSRGLEAASGNLGAGRSAVRRDAEVQILESRMSTFTIPDLSLMEGRKSGMSGHLLFLYNLAREIRARNIVEIGLGGGNSSMAFLPALRETRGRLTSVDIGPCAEARRSIDGFRDNVDWKFLQARSDDAVVSLREADPIDILLIDGFHSYDQCRSDYFNYAPLVREGGYILFHDSSTIQGVMEFTAELLERGLGGINLDYCNGLFVFHKKTGVIW